MRFCPACAEMTTAELISFPEDKLMSSSTLPGVWQHNPVRFVCYVVVTLTEGVLV
jgi:hypothetical protein